MDISEKHADERSPLTGRPLLIATDQAMMEVHRHDNGVVYLKSKAGGAAKVIAGHFDEAIRQGRPVIVVVHPKSDVERQYAQSGRPYIFDYNGQPIPYYFVPGDEQEYKRGREAFSAEDWLYNQSMPPGAFHRPPQADRWEASKNNGYRMAHLLAQLAPLNAEIHVHDGQNQAVGLYLPELVPDATTLYFSHTAEGGLDYYRGLPPDYQRPEVTREKYQAKAGFDATVFQTPSWQTNYETVAAALEVKLRPSQCSSALVAVDAPSILAEFASVQVQGQAATGSAPGYRGTLAEVGALIGDRFSTVVDGRCEPYKGIPTAVEGMLYAFRNGLLDVRENVLHILTAPTRTDIPEYKQYGEDVVTAVAAANISLGYAADAPDRPFVISDGSDYHLVLAGLARADYHATDPINEGCNMMGEECALVNTRGFVQGTSRSAGAYQRTRPLSADGEDLVISLQPRTIVTDSERATGRFDVPGSDAMEFAFGVLEARDQFRPERSAQRFRNAETLHDLAYFNRPGSHLNQLVAAGKRAHAEALALDPGRATRSRPAPPVIGPVRVYPPSTFGGHATSPHSRHGHAVPVGLRSAPKVGARAK